MSDKQLKAKAIQFKGSQYVQVKDRIMWLDENHQGEYSIDTEYQFLDSLGAWVVKATLSIKDQKFTGHGQEIEGSSFINKTSALENAETSAVGRACAMAGIGVIDSIASNDEITKATNRDADDRPWLSQAQFDKIIERINNGEKLTEQTKKEFRMKKIYREALEEAENFSNTLES